MKMQVCVGRWDLLPEEWDGINGLYNKSGKAILKEAEREEAAAAKEYPDDRFIGVFSLVEFEEELNQYIDDGRDDFSPVTHWVKFVYGSGKKLEGV